MDFLFKMNKKIVIAVCKRENLVNEQFKKSSNDKVVFFTGLEHLCENSPTNIIFDIEQKILKNLSTDYQEKFAKIPFFCLENVKSTKDDSEYENLKTFIIDVKKSNIIDQTYQMIIPINFSIVKNENNENLIDTKIEPVTIFDINTFELHHYMKWYVERRCATIENFDIFEKDIDYLVLKQMLKNPILIAERIFPFLIDPYNWNESNECFYTILHLSKKSIWEQIEKLDLNENIRHLLIQFLSIWGSNKFYNSKITDLAKNIIMTLFKNHNFPDFENIIERQEILESVENWWKQNKEFFVKQFKIQVLKMLENQVFEFSSELTQFLNNLLNCNKLKITKQLSIKSTENIEIISKKFKFYENKIFEPLWKNYPWLKIKDSLISILNYGRLSSDFQVYIVDNIPGGSVTFLIGLKEYPIEKHNYPLNPSNILKFLELVKIILSPIENGQIRTFNIAFEIAVDISNFLINLV